MYGGEMTKLGIQGRLTMCVHSGKCRFSDPLIIYSEMMVDEQIVNLQRTKISTMKRFFGTIGDSRDSCVLVKSLPSLHAQLNEINSRQIDRLKALADQRLP